ncbi:MAG: FIST C-terminal domain-containing protein [Deltaproteobacteria bacterium]|nr:FIST C-terminal domain-containing protein [Deltaproteobacteria bacterium]
MRVEQLHWRDGEGWTGGNLPQVKAQWVLALGSGEHLRSGRLCAPIFARYPDAIFTGCSTAGEILGRRVYDGSLVVTAVELERSRVRLAKARVEDQRGSFAAGHQLAAELIEPELKHVLVLSDGLRVNGTGLVAGLRSGLPPSITVSGGLAGDGQRMSETFVCAGGHPESGIIAAVGFYGSALEISCGSTGGWDAFGPERLVTRSDGNVLYELDGQSALGLYRRYLGEHAAGLPATGLLFPLSLRNPGQGTGVVRTILGVDEKRQSLIFAGEVPTGSFVRLMRANLDRLVDGAFGAAKASLRSDLPPELTVLVSCVGRRLVLRQRIEEELDGVAEVIGPAPMAGFYSYGELAPGPAASCELHNQTMTVTSFREGPA